VGRARATHGAPVALSRPLFIFAYGSLTTRAGGRLQRGVDREGFIADLRGFTRGWGVAMDNRRDLPGYKYYTAPDGDRPAVYVAFLDVRETETPEQQINGVCLPVEEQQLAELDRRERNYARREVSDRIDAGGARVWTYVGTPDGRERLAQGRRTGAAVINAGYLRTVEAAFGALGRGEQTAAQASFDPGDIPVIELMRHELA
jgi:gamma-glutamylcyclotransferase (GGCT)/AIG2-like uncharacterized protein YtfP